MPVTVTPSRHHVLVDAVVLVPQLLHVVVTLETYPDLPGLDELGQGRRVVEVVMTRPGHGLRGQHAEGDVSFGVGNSSVPTD